MDTKTDNYWRILQNTLDMSRHADSKATAVLSICGILVSIGFTNTEALFNSSIHPWILGVMILLPGLTIMISVQALVSISVVLGLLPTKGIPLPFVSAGGSSLIINLLGMGVLLNISRHATSEA